MAVIPLRVEVGDEVRTRTEALGRVEEMITGPPQSNFSDAERYLRVRSRARGSLYIPFSEIADVSRVLNVVYLKPHGVDPGLLDWQDDPRVPRTGRVRPAQIGDRFQEGDPITQPGQYICTACGFRKHSQQLREESGGDRFPAPHHLGAAWALDDYRA